MKILFSLPLIFFALAFALALHQYIFHGMWFAIEDLHHETWIAMFGFTGFILFVTRKR